MELTNKIVRYCIARNDKDLIEFPYSRFTIYFQKEIIEMGSDTYEFLELITFILVLISSIENLDFYFMN